MDGDDIQTLIESNNPSEIEDLKKKFYEQFNSSKYWKLETLREYFNNNTLVY